MSRMRRALGPIAVVWLTCQIAWVSAAPIVFAVIASDAAVECTCGHHDHEMCPMHHKTAPGSKVCFMRGDADGGLAVLSSLLGVAGLVPVPAPLAKPAAADAAAPAGLTTASLRPPPPEPPPPRA